MPNAIMAAGIQYFRVVVAYMHSASAMSVDAADSAVVMINVRVFMAIALLSRLKYFDEVFFKLVIELVAFGFSETFVQA